MGRQAGSGRWERAGCWAGECVQPGGVSHGGRVPTEGMSYRGHVPEEGVSRQERVLLEGVFLERPGEGKAPEGPSNCPRGRALMDSRQRQQPPVCPGSRGRSGDLRQHPKSPSKQMHSAGPTESSSGGGTG